MLFCQNCPKTCGTMVPSNKVLVSECEAFGNSNGKLVCDLPLNDDNLPLGTYLDSCGGCKVTETKRESDGGSIQKLLSCSHCKNTRGTMEPTEMIVADCQIIGNNMGQLVCESMEAPARQTAELEGLPDGPYLDSCSGCRYELEDGEEVALPHHVLQCSCRTGKGTTMKSTKLVLRDPCPTPILNKNGKLTCPLEPMNRVENGKIGHRVEIKSDDGSLDVETFKQVPLAEGWSVTEDGGVIPPAHHDEL